MLIRFTFCANRHLVRPSFWRRGMKNKITMESVLFKAIDILVALKIDYWVTDGTLLGIIRENRILPWDSDVDLGVWKSEISTSEIVHIFKAHGFHYIESLSAMDSLHFRMDDVQLDINLYTEQDGETSVKWASNPVGTVDKLIVQITNKIFENDKRSHIHNKGKEPAAIFAIRNVLLFGAFFLTKGMREKMYEFARSRYLYLGCAYPTELMSTKKIIFKEKEIRVPLKCEEYLYLTYGEDWQTPNRNYIWEEDTTNLKTLNYKSK